MSIPLPLLIKDVQEWKQYCTQLKKQGSIGFIPTMGALHDGHISLCKKAQSMNDFVLTSVFVNPTQFNDKKDLDAYPRTIEHDLEMLGAAGVKAVFNPEYEMLYPDNYRYKITESDLSGKYCGAFRKGHFNGVLTVVMKLLCVTGADNAYFGEKDFQQFILIRDMANAFFLNTKIIPCPIIREESGLAMSSRNERLSLDGRKKASEIYAALKEESLKENIWKRLEKNGFVPEYVEDFFDEVTNVTRRLVAVHFENVRLIDNIQLSEDSKKGIVYE